MTTLTKTAIPMKEWMQRSTLGFFKRNENMMMVPQVVHLGHDVVTKILSRSFEPVSRDAHYITIASRLILAERVSGKVYQEEEIFKAEMAIHKQFERINDFLDMRIRQAEQKLQHAGIDPNVVQRTTRAFEAKCTTRTANDFLQLLTKADIYLSMHHYLWIFGELSDNSEEALKAKLNNERDVRNHLATIARTTMTHFNVLRRICNGVMDQRRVEREKQSERDKKRNASKKKKAAVKEASGAETGGDVRVDEDQPVPSPGTPLQPAAAAERLQGVA